MVLQQCPGVQDCAIFGIPDDEFGESLAAAVQLLPDTVLTAEQIRDYLNQRLSSYKVPRRVDFHDNLPREDSGKIFKRRLRAGGSACHVVDDAPYRCGREHDARGDQQHPALR